MEELDKVYSTFTNLNRYYSNSKKPKSTIIADKLGTDDIKLGTTLILEYLSQSSLESPEDIRKLTEIKRIFNFIIKHSDNLDNLPDLKFDESVVDVTPFLALLDQGIRGTSNYERCTQPDLYMSKKCLHYSIDAKGCHYVQYGDAIYHKAINSGTITNLKSCIANQDVSVNLGDCFVAGHNGLQPVDNSTIANSFCVTS